MTEAGSPREPAKPPANGQRRCKGHQLTLHRSSDPRREELERFVRDVFASRHGARVCSFMPTLLAMRNETGAVCSVAGFRSAADQSLFLERYLDTSVERAIASSTGQQVSRDQIVEVGNLAGINCRSAMRLVLDLPGMLLDRGHRWIVFTATDTLRELLTSYHAPLIELAMATASSVQDTGDDWGRYYESHPRVMAGYLPDRVSLCRRRRK